MRKYILFFVVVLFFTGCSHNFMRSDYTGNGYYEEFVNNKIQHHSSEVKLLTGQQLDAEEVYITPNRDSVICSSSEASSSSDSAFLLKYLSGNIYRLPINIVESISYSSRTGAELLGLRTGLLGGATIGSVTLNIDPSSSNSGNHPNAAANALTGGAIGAAAGTLIGAFAGQKYIFLLSK